MQDISLYDNGSGGDVLFTTEGNDLEVALGFQNQPYLALFGSPGPWWGNQFLDNNKYQLFDAQTPLTLREIKTTTGGIELLKSAIQKDLDYGTNFSTIDINIIVERIRRLKIEIRFGVNPDSDLFRPIIIDDLLQENTIIIPI